MNFIQIFLLSVSLAADAFAVAVGAGISQKKILLKQALAMALCFGIFQAAMPIIGYTLASLFSDIIVNYDHWIAFILLGYIGWNMIYEWWKWDDEEKDAKNIFGLRSLCILWLATSIDALAVGVSLTATEKSIWPSAIMIGIVTFVLSFIGVEFGKRFGMHIGKKAEIIWWIILMGIGSNILYEHIM
jgi:putative Mn2+ efflux pump MntP